LVTGGAGFLRSHLYEHLRAAGNDVLYVYDYFTGSKQKVKGCLTNRASSWSART
jgi:nucleoside-diphosphate-sugar epimerase